MRRHFAFIDSLLGTKLDRDFRHYYESGQKGLHVLTNHFLKSAPRLSHYSTGTSSRSMLEKPVLIAPNWPTSWVTRRQERRNVTMGVQERRAVALACVQMVSRITPSDKRTAN